MDRVEMLGGFSVHAEGGSVWYPAHKVGCLAALLLWNRDSWLPRQRIWSQLWPDSAEKRAASNLRQTIHRLTQALAGAGVGCTLEARRDAVRICAGPDGISVDARDFADGAAQALSADTSDLATLVAAVDRYRGTFLPGLDGDWIDETRRDLEDLYVRALHKTIDALTHVGMREAAAAYGKRWVHAEPLNEHAHRSLMRLYNDSGAPGSAIHQFEECRRILAESLGVEPSAETLRVAEEIGLMDPGQAARPRRRRHRESGAVLHDNLSHDPLYKAGLLLALGQRRAEAGLTDAALFHLEKARAVYAKEGHQEGVARVDMAIAQAHMGSTTGPKPELAVPRIEAALDYFSSQPESPLYAKALYQAAFVFSLVGDDDRQFELAHRGLQLADQSRNSDYRARFETLLAMQTMMKYRLSDAREYLDSIGTALPFMVNPADVALYMVYEAQAAFLSGNLKDAEKRYEELLVLVNSLPPGNERAAVEIPGRILLMTVLNFEGKYAKARSHNPIPELEGILPEHVLCATRLLMRPGNLREACIAASDMLEPHFDHIIDEQAPMFMRLMCEFMWDVGLFENSAHWSEKGMDFGTQRGWPRCAAIFRAYRARALAGLGDTSNAVADANDALEHRDPLDRWTEIVALWALAMTPGPRQPAVERNAVAALSSELGFGHYVSQLLPA